MTAQRSPFEVRPIAEHEFEAFLACLEMAFSAPTDEAERDPRLSDIDRLLGAFETGGDGSFELVGTAGSHLVELSLPGGGACAAAAVSSVSVMPTYTRRGGMTALMTTLLERCRQRGEPVAVLHASEGGLYGRFGYGMATMTARYELRRAGACFAAEADRLVPAQSAGAFRLRLLGGRAAAEACRSVFDLYRRRVPGEISRPPLFWQHPLGESAPGLVLELAQGERGAPVLDGASRSDPTRAPGAAGTDPADRVARRVVVAERSGRIDGYAVYSVAPDAHHGGFSERVVDCHELVALDRAAELALWRAVAAIDLTAAVRAHTRPLDEPLRFALVDPRQLRVTGTTDGIWLRLVEVTEALRARRYGVAGTLVLELVDELCPWNTGGYLLEVDEKGWATVTGPTPGHAGALGGRDAQAPSGSAGGARIALGAAALASSYLGGVRLATLAAAGLVEERGPGGIALADRMLGPCPGEPVAFCSSHF